MKTKYKVIINPYGRFAPGVSTTYYALAMKKCFWWEIIYYVQKRADLERFMIEMKLEYHSKSGYWYREDV